MEPAELAFEQRSRFFEALDEQIARCNRSHTALGLLLVDLRNFRRINAVYGFQIGNQLLQLVQNRIVACLRAQDIIARVGDDRFAVVLPELPHGEVVRLAASKILKAIKDPFTLQEHNVKLDACIGVAVHSVAGMSGEKFLLEAEKSLKFAKQRNLPYAILEMEASLSHDQEWAMEEQLHHALDRDQLFLYYQPIIDMESRLPLHAEALMRWNHPELGFVPPTIFIPIAERAGLMDTLTKWVLSTALRDLQQWPTMDGQAIRPSINLSATTLHDQDLIDMVYSALRIWGGDASDLTLEITETALMQDPDTSREHLSVLQDSGLRIAIDDFGTGYSSLDYFKSIPANELKVDRSFVSRLFDNHADEKIIRLIIDLAKSFGLEVVAEGVEDLKTLLALRDMGCSAVQGFFFSKALPNTEFKHWLESYRPDAYF